MDCPSIASRLSHCINPRDLTQNGFPSISHCIYLASFNTQNGLPPIISIGLKHESSIIGVLLASYCVPNSAGFVCRRRLLNMTTKSLHTRIYTTNHGWCFTQLVGGCSRDVLMASRSLRKFLESHYYWTFFLKSSESTSRTTTFRILLRSF